MFCCFGRKTYNKNPQNKWPLEIKGRLSIDISLAAAAAAAAAAENKVKAARNQNVEVLRRL